MMMNAIHPPHVLLVLVFVLCMKTSQPLSKDGNVIKCIETERRALLEFKQHGGVYKPDYLDSWKNQEQDCCKWNGVGCDNLTGHVTHLQLSSLLSPSSGTGFKISNSLLGLPYLNYLDLSSNTLAGFPEFIGSLTNLVHINLSNTLISKSVSYQWNFSWNLLNVSIPKSIGSLNSLRYLDLSSNSFVGGIPHELGNLSKLQHLDLGDNYLGLGVGGTGNFEQFFHLPIPKFIGSLNSLRYLDLSYNYFSGVILHELGNLSKLQHLDLGNNYNDVPADVTIPKSIGSLNSLRYLDLSSNSFVGVIPHELGNLSKLQHLDLGVNYLGVGGDWSFNLPIPKFIGSLNSLTYLDLFYNHFVGDIPHELGNLSKLQHLDLGGNFGLAANGNFQWFFNLHTLTYLDFSFIHFAQPGIWVSFIERIPSLSVMRLNGCNLSAPSSTLSNFSSSISTLHLAVNNINSSIFNWLSHLNGSLVELDLDDNMLEGRIPESFGHMTALTHLHLSRNQLTGVLSKSICNLSSLQVVDFSYNNFTGSLPDFTGLSSLYSLSLDNNGFSGNLPNFTGLSFLGLLHLHNNEFSGSLPDFTGLSSLNSLLLDNNGFSGSLPNFTGLSLLSSLHLHNNQFSGSLPDFTGCVSLTDLRLDENRLTEWNTQSTGLLSSLQVLNLSMNSIHSTISETHLSNLSSLMFMYISSNSLTFELSFEWLPPFQLRELSLASCKLGPKFPNWIRNQRDIDHLDISNSQISDTIPIWLWNLSSSMKLLNLSSNQITGKIFWKYDHIQEIDLSSNYLVGSLPPIPTECLKINLSKNNFSGTLLSLSVVEDISLSFLDVSHNHLFGALPDNWMHFQGLVFLNLGYNNFSGRIPMSMGHLVSLQTLILRNNKISDELPKSLRNCSKLGFVDFGLNDLSGIVPSWIGEGLPKLYALILKSNRFYGSLPYKLCHLSDLHFLDLSMNRISGNIPPCFGYLTAMIQRGTEVSEHNYTSTFGSSAGSPNLNNSRDTSSSYSYFDNVLARWKGQELEYGRNFAYLKMIDLSANELTGEIPAGITGLLELEGLNLSGNKLNGKVPLEIGQLKGLEFLDLSRNRFSGEIPPSMSALHFLAYLDVSNNNFSGRIPSGTQLQGFNISTYEGNPGLCGKPLPKSCPGDEQVNHIRPSGEVEVDEEDIEYKRWLYISAALGFSTTFWGLIGSLVLNRRWRHAYFQFLYKLKERIIVAMAVRIARLHREA